MIELILEMILVIALIGVIAALVVAVSLLYVIKAIQSDVRMLMALSQGLAPSSTRPQQESEEPGRSYSVELDGSVAFSDGEVRYPPNHPLYDPAKTERDRLGRVEPE